MQRFLNCRFPAVTVLGIAALGVGLTGIPASAAVINVSVDGQVNDSDADELGNVSATTGTVSAGGGDSPTRREYRSVFEFNIASSTADIAAAQSITFSVQIRDFYTGSGTSSTSPSATVPDFALYALTADEDGAIGINDYEAAGTLVATFDPNDYEAGDIITANVTSYVKADAAALSSWSAFRLQAADPSTTPIAIVGGNTWQLTRFIESERTGTSARLTTVVPEPTSFALLGLGGLIALHRRR